MSDKNGATLIVGADSDIGSCLAKKLSGDVIVHCFAKPERFENTGISNAKYYPVFGDLSTADGINAFIDGVKALDLPINKLVHLPAAPAAAARFKSFDENRYIRDINITALSAALVCREFVPLMAKRGFGRVAAVLTSYCLGAPPKYLASYVSSKYALMGLLRSLAVEYAAKGVTVNAVAPSMVQTSFLSTLPDFEIESSAKANPLGRNATPQDVASALLYLLDDGNEFLNGAVIPLTAATQL